MRGEIERSGGRMTPTEPLNILNTSDRKLTTNWLNLISLQAYILMKTSR